MVVTAARGSKADDGIDAPGVVRNLAIGGMAGVAATLIVSRMRRRRLPAKVFLGWTAFSGVTSIFTAAYMVWGSKVGKLAEAKLVFDLLSLRGDERVLDVGWGCGVMLVTGAKRLENGRAVGLDVWRAKDQTGNRREATLESARAEGVADKVCLIDGDARDLPLSKTASTPSYVALCCTTSPSLWSASGPCGRLCACSNQAAAWPLLIFNTPMSTCACSVQPVSKMLRAPDRTFWSTRRCVW